MTEAIIKKTYMVGDEDITDRLELAVFARGLTAGPTESYDLRLPGEEVNDLYDFINTYRYAISQFWH
ncbi:MAG: hypothetical protein QOH25_1030 [Acidobacteriota bacterium]|nr:hypothetical protein [Acidobacteriota bacterium]